MTRVGSAVSTLLGDRVTLGLVSLGMLTMFFEVLRLVLCRLGAGSGVLLRGNSVSLIIGISLIIVYLQLCIIGIVSLLAYMYHFVMCIMHSCRYYTVCIYNI